MAICDVHRLAGRREVRLQDFVGDDFVLPLGHMSPIFYDSIIAACRNAGISPTIPPHQARNLLTILSLVSVGAGVSVVPRTLAGVPGVVFKRLRGQVPINEVSVVWRADNRSPVLARALQALGLIRP